MELKEIKDLNQKIYELDVNVTRDQKVIFIASIVFALTQNTDFQNPNKLTTLINFHSEEKKPIDQLIAIAEEGILKLGLLSNTQKAIQSSLKIIAGASTSLDRNRDAFCQFISDFISNYFPAIKPGDIFFETLYMEIDKKAKGNNKGVVLTPVFIARLMVDLIEIDYKKDVVADLCSGTGLFSLLSYSQMLESMDKELKENKITQEEYKKYHSRLYNSIIANDNEPKMVTLCLANFLLKSLNHTLLFSEDVFNLEKSFFKIDKDGVSQKIYPTKAILNPPYEDNYKPLEILEKNITLVKDNESKGNKVVVIVPPQKFGKSKDTFSKILNIATLESVIKTQDDLFQDSGTTQATSIFVFNVDAAHSKDNIVHYYNFTDTGYVYLKDSGMVDKNNTFESKKQNLLDKIKNATQDFKKSDFIRSWDNFYEVNKEIEIDTIIDPDKIKTSKEEADITLENITIKRMLKEKNELIEKVNNSFKDTDGSFEKYILDILSENI